MLPTPRLQARALTKRYGEVTALHPLDLTIQAGDVFCLLGANGAGKTTTINLFLNFIAPTDGTALVCGIDVTVDPIGSKRHLAYIPETVMLYKNLTAIENLEYFAALATNEPFQREQLLGFLTEAGLRTEQADQRVGGFSKGMRQKVGIAIAIAKGADVLLLDEPTSGLDPKAANEFSELIARLRELGCHPNAIHVTGNAKFDAATPTGGATLDVPALLRPLGVPDDAQLLVAGSTHAGEEILLARMFLRLRERFPKLFLVLVPRHFERTAAVVEELRPTGIRLALRTELADGKVSAPGSVDGLLVNTTGELRHFYRHATVVFVGKSLTAEGGQNPIEPGALGKAMLFGPHMENFRPIAAEFIACDGAVQVPDAAALEGAFATLLSDPARRDQLGANALGVVRRNEGAADRTAEMIARALR